MAAFKGFVSHIIYRNEENGYTVFEVTLTGEDCIPAGEAGAGSPETDADAGSGEPLTCVGYPPSIREGESCAVEGEYVTHPVYGEQLRVQAYRALAPEGVDAIYRYLSAGGIRGIGQATAAKIVRRFGRDALRVMEEEPEKLAQIRGISLRIAREIGAQMEDRKEQRDAMIFLQQYGIGNVHAVRIWQAYGIGLYEVLQTNPYRLAEEIRGIGFATADEIARRAGIRADSEFRIRSGLLYVLAQALGEGNSFLPEDDLVRRTCTLLRLPPEDVLLQTENLAVERRLRLRRRPSAPPGELPPSPEGPAQADPAVEVYLAAVYRREQEIARMLLDLDAAVQASPLGGSARGKLEEKVARLEAEEEITLDPLQRQAVLESARNAVLVITGGPGTGKTTTINTIIRFFRGEDMQVLLAAPTGRAARRMTEATGSEAMTIHRLLGVRTVGDGEEGRDGPFMDKGALFAGGFSAESAPPGGREGQKSEKKNKNYSFFERKEDNPLEADAVIIDEMSMVDMNLFHALLRAVPPGARLVLVGDVNQLPSVGPGCVLQDLIEAGAFHTIMLRHIFRQASESDIVMNAHRILEGESLPMDNRSRDFFFLERDRVPVIYKHTVELLSRMLPGYVGCRPEEIQVLTPMRRGSLGVERLNAVLQSVLNPPAKGRREHVHQETVFREGDKVMQTRNNYQLSWEKRGNFGMPIEQGEGIFNGDFGRIEQIDPQTETMMVCFDDARTVEYPFQELDDLELAYAITVHKSQGSEYPAVILPLLDGPSGLFNRNLLYTAVTRARNCVVVLGSRGAVDRMIANNRRSGRHTGLRDRITEMWECGADRYAAHGHA